MKLDLIFDLDDTLSDCGIYYRNQQKQFTEFQSQRTGLPEELIHTLRENIDVTFTSTPDGFSRARFPRSFASTSATIDIMLGNPVDETAAERSFLLGDEVFNAMYPLRDGIEDMLNAYMRNEHRLYILTKGDYDVQIRKVALNGLRQWFDNDRIYIVAQKTSDDLQRVLTDHNINPINAVMIGDSMRDDVGNAKTVGITSVWVKNHNTPKWSYENVPYKPDYELDHTTELIHLIDPIKGQFTR